MAEVSKVLVTGASELKDEHVHFAQELGSRLMRETSAILLTGGLKLKSRDKSKRPALDGIVAEAASNALQNEVGAVSRRIITMLPDSKRDDAPMHERVEVGTVIRVPYSDRRSRRYAMVVHSDAVIAVGGSEATREVIDLAYIAGKPIILLPSTGGAARKCWEDYKPDLLARLNLSNDELSALNDETNLSRGVSACICILQRVLLPRCFVAMPFSDHPEPNAYDIISSVAKEHGYQVVRVDREKFSGSIVEEVWHSIQHCDLAVVDLTEHRPNVYYEMGIAHALNKPTLLLVFSENGCVPDDIPFDIRVQRILPYGTTQSLRGHLKAQLPIVGTHRRLRPFSTRDH